MKLTISAIIPSRNRTTELGRALRSVLAQRHQPFEIVVVNDGRQRSIEEIGANPNGTRDPAIRIVVNSRAAGASGARNQGAEVAQGSWLAFLDDDDEWLPEYLAQAVDRMIASDLDAICTDLAFEWLVGSGKPGKPACEVLAPEEFLTRNPGLVGSNLIIRRSLFLDLGGFDESLPFAEDMDFGLRLALRGGVRYQPLHLPLVRAYQHGSARLCTPGSDVVRTGIRRFFELHSHRMTEAQQTDYDNRMRRLWGFTGSGQ